MGFLLGDRRQRAMSGTNQSLRRQRKYLLSHFLAGELPRLVAAADRAREHRVADDRHVRRILRPGANHVRRAVFGMAGRVPMRDPQAAQMDEIVRTIPLVDRRM